MLPFRCVAMETAAADRFRGTGIGDGDNRLYRQIADQHRPAATAWPKPSLGRPCFLVRTISGVRTGFILLDAQPDLGSCRALQPL